jgi:hypothetical protein
MSELLVLSHDRLPARVRRQVARNRGLNVNRLHQNGPYSIAKLRKAAKLTVIASLGSEPIRVCLAQRDSEQA